MSPEGYEVVAVVADFMSGKSPRSLGVGSVADLVQYPRPVPRASSVSGRAGAPGGRWPSFREARALILGGLRVRGWVWRLAMLWVVLGARRGSLRLCLRHGGVHHPTVHRRGILVSAMERGTSGDRRCGRAGSGGLAAAGCAIAGGGVRPAPCLAAARTGAGRLRGPVRGSRTARSWSWPWSWPGTVQTFPAWAGESCRSSPRGWHSEPR